MRYKYLFLALFMPTSAYAKRYRKLNQTRLAKATKQAPEAQPETTSNSSGSTTPR